MVAAPVPPAGGWDGSAPPATRGARRGRAVVGAAAAVALLGGGVWAVTGGDGPNGGNPQLLTAVTATPHQSGRRLSLGADAWPGGLTGQRLFTTNNGEVEAYDLDSGDLQWHDTGSAVTAVDSGVYMCSENGLVRMNRDGVQQGPELSDAGSCAYINQLSSHSLQLGWMDGFDLVALLQDFRRVIDLPRPRDVGDVDHAVETFLEFDEGAVAGEVADLALDLCSGRILLLGMIPRVALELAHAKGDFLFFAIDAEHHGLDLLVLLEDVGGLGNALGPGEFGDVDEAFDTGLEFHERAVGHEVDHAAFDPRADGILGFDVVPRIGHLLLEAEADALLLAIDVENDDVDVLSDLKHFGRMADAAPAHVGDMEQAVDAVEVDERAEVGDVLDGALADVARGHLREELLAPLHAFLFDEFAAREDDVLAFLVDLDDLELVGVADVLLEVLRRGDVDLGGGQEGFDADVDEEAAFDDRFDFAADGAALVANGEDAFPVLLEFSLLAREDDHAFAVFELFDQDIDFVADLDGLDVVELGGGDDAFAFVADIDEDFLGTDFDDGAFDDFACGKAHIALLQGFFHCEHTLRESGRETGLVSRWSAGLRCLTDQTLRVGNGG